MRRKRGMELEKILYEVCDSVLMTIFGIKIGGHHLGRNIEGRILPQHNKNNILLAQFLTQFRVISMKINLS